MYALNLPHRSHLYTYVYRINVKISTPHRFSSNLFPNLVRRYISLWKFSTIHLFPLISSLSLPEGTPCCCTPCKTPSFLFFLFFFMSPSPLMSACAVPTAALATTVPESDGKKFLVLGPQHPERVLHPGPRRLEAELRRAGESHGRVDGGCRHHYHGEPWKNAIAKTEVRVHACMYVSCCARALDSRVLHKWLSIDRISADASCMSLHVSNEVRACSHLLGL